MGKQMREAKKRQARSRRGRSWASALPYLLVVGGDVPPAHQAVSERDGT